MPSCGIGDASWALHERIVAGDSSSGEIALHSPIVGSHERGVGGIRGRF